MQKQNAAGLNLSRPRTKAELLRCFAFKFLYTFTEIFWTIKFPFMGQPKIVKWLSEGKTCRLMIFKTMEGKKI